MRKAAEAVNNLDIVTWFRIAAVAGTMALVAVTCFLDEIRELLAL